MPSKSSLKIRPYQVTDKAAILAIYAKVWGKEKAQRLGKIWPWKYDTSLFGMRGSDHSFVAEKDGLVIGFVGTIPAMFKINDRTCKGLWLGDLMIDPQHRGIPGVKLCKTIISNNENNVLMGHADSGYSGGAIARNLWMRIKKTKKDVSYVSNLFKRISIQGVIHDKCGSEFVARSVDYVWYFLKKRAEDTSSGLVLDDITHFDIADKERINEIIASYKNISLKNVEHLNWRYFKRPDVRYTVYVAREQSHMKGYVVLRCKKDAGKLNGRIVDLIAANGDKKTIRFLMAASEAYFRKLGVRQARAYAIKGSFIENELMGFGFSSHFVSDPVFPLLGEYPDENLFVHNAWCVSFSDSDFDMD
ncbi:MAG TPA: N-acetyltransferase [Gammaproteobacteria bacterium]|nr:N-acetyltransferase [Gammaproteobacteria bacterium]